MTKHWYMTMRHKNLEQQILSLLYKARVMGRMPPYNYCTQSFKPLSINALLYYQYAVLVVIKENGHKDSKERLFKEVVTYEYGTAEPSHATKFSSANADREIFVFPVQLTTSRIGNLTRLIHTLSTCVTIHTASPTDYVYRS